MQALSPVFQERVERGMQWREYFYLITLVAFSIYQLSGVGGETTGIELLFYFGSVFLAVLMDRGILYFIKMGKGTDWFTFISSAKDIFLVTYLIHLTGGIESPFIILYFLVAIGFAAAVGFVYGIYILIAICFSFFVLVYFEYSGILHHHPQTYFHKVQDVSSNFWILGMVTAEVFTLGVALILSNRYISRRLRTREKELAGKLEEIGKINKQLEESTAELVNLSSQIEHQKEVLERNNRLLKVLYNITSHLVEHYTPEVLIRRIHNEISNKMPVLGCALITREKETEKFHVVSTINDFAIDDNHEDIFYKTVELNDIYVTEKILSFPVKIDVHKQIVFMCYKDIQSRQLREEEIRIIYSTAKQMAIFIDRFELYKQLQHLSNTDGLTGLYNHRFFHICLDKEINRCQTYHKPLSLIIMDMDNFKQVNDRFGHQEGDRILSIIAGLLKECFRNSDVLARYGGDEFVAVLPETDGATAMHIAERILEKIRVTDISVGGETIRLSISAGISCVGEEEVISSRELISKADTALYEAKKTGRGSIKFL